MNFLDVPPNIASINDTLLPIVLFFIYFAILLYFFYEFKNTEPTNLQDYIPEIEERIVITPTVKVDPESDLIDRFLGENIAKNPEELKRKFLNLKFNDSLEHFSMYDLYCIAQELGLSFKLDEKKYKPIEELKTEIKEIFERSPSSALAALVERKVC